MKSITRVAIKMTALYLAVFMVLTMALATELCAVEAPVVPELTNGMVDGVGFDFAVTGSVYRDVTLQSTNQVDVLLQTAPGMVIINIEATSGTISTSLTIGNLEPLTTYYMYEDTLENPVNITTDAAGSYTYTQDLTAPHLITIKTEPSTYFIRNDATGGDCTTIGMWNGATSTCTLTTDLTGPASTIDIRSNGITLDGNGHTLSGGRGGYGIYLRSLNNVTVRNLKVNNFIYGIYVSSSSNILIENNNLSNIVVTSIYARASNNLTIQGNTVVNSINLGILTLDNNTVLISNNTVTGCTKDWALAVYYDFNVTVKDNTITNNWYGMWIRDYDGYGRGGGPSLVTGNNISDNTTYGLYASHNRNSTFSENTLARNARGIHSNQYFGINN